MKIFLVLISCAFALACAKQSSQNDDNQNPSQPTLQPAPQPITAPQKSVNIYKTCDQQIILGSSKPILISNELKPLDDGAYSFNGCNVYVSGSQIKSDQPIDLKVCFSFCRYEVLTRKCQDGHYQLMNYYDKDYDMDLEKNDFTEAEFCN